MAFCGRVSASGEIVLRDEIFSSTTRLRRSSSSSDSPNSMSSPDSLPQNITSRTFSIKDDNGNPAVQSGDHWSDLYDGLRRSESQSNVVPSLCFSTQKSPLNYLRHIEGIKVGREPEAAYENWYSAKQRLRLERQQRLKQEQQYKQQMLEERKQLAQVCYDQWLKDKARRSANLQLENHLQAAAMKASLALGKSPLPSLTSPSTSLGSGASSSSTTRPMRNVSQDEIRQVVEEWWLKKQQQQQAHREEKRRAMLSRALDEERRKQLAQAAWRKWMSNVEAKPKPVPLNQGMDSLRGTISKLYVNPSPWLGPLKPPSK
ncbi:coiled-coil domain-containing protein 34 [Drosophila elegans]|uniref:coiled-coil domain-containing protein 34 n=1 Tax=Drosophila elegans TaxID=30023 RepID=UPI0007E73BE7|nr:coiled-coil domain-containing protein 34 [Drosophila elegans]XP_041564710.1 coiled-coil domain-containing protein 34 [Drosophila elegans]